MPSMRRIKVFGLLIFLVVVTLLFWTASVRQQREPDSRTAGDFYQKTVNGLNKKPSTGGSTGGTADEEVAKAMAQSLKEAAQVAKDKANAKAPKPDPPSILVGVGSAAEGSERGVAGRKKFGAGEAQEPVKEETEEDHEVEAELNSILKKSPSKCFHLNVPHSSGHWSNDSFSSQCLSSFKKLELIWGFHSNHLLEILLPLFQEGEKYSAQ